MTNGFSMFLPQEIANQSGFTSLQLERPAGSKAVAAGDSLAEVGKPGGGAMVK